MDSHATESQLRIYLELDRFQDVCLLLAVSSELLRTSSGGEALFSRLSLTNAFLPSATRAILARHQNPHIALNSVSSRIWKTHLGHLADNPEELRRDVV